LSRLNSSWILDDELRSDITDDILDQILDRGRSKVNPKIIQALEAENWPINEQITSDTDPDTIDSYVKQIRNFTKSGKTDFTESELFELFQSIHEHNLLIHPSFKSKFRVSDCQFRILSNPILSSLENDDFSRSFRSICRKAEKKLTNLLVNTSDEEFESRYEEELSFPHVIQALIECVLLLPNGEVKKITFRNSSTATHTENMLSALKNGLCHPLKVQSVYIRVPGSTEKSLARVTMNLFESNQENSEDLKLTNNKKVYQGWWVDSNIVVGVSKATVDAIKRWMSVNSINFDYFYQTGSSISEIGQDLFDIRDLIYENSPGHEGERLVNVENRIKDEITRIEKLVESGKVDEKNYELHLARLNRQLYLSQLMQLHSSLMGNSEILPKGQESIESKNVGEYLESCRKRLNRSQDEYKKLLFIYWASCKMIYKFMTGDHDFIVKRQWRDKPEYSLERLILQLEGYVKKSTLSIDFDTYLYVSKICGVAGFLEFYTADRITNFKESCKRSIMAAHFSSRIGHARWTAYWLSYASRSYAAMNDLDSAKRLLKFAENNASGNKRSLDIGKLENLPFSWSQANIELARGEIYLKNKAKTVETIRSFCTALKIATYFGFRRLTADCYYNLARVLSTPGLRGKDAVMDYFFKSFIRVSELLKQLLGGDLFYEHSSCQSLYKLTERIKASHSGNSELIKNQFVDILMEESKVIWNLNLSSQDPNAVHPIVESIHRFHLFKVTV
jgi:hypothetical protein